MNNKNQEQITISKEKYIELIDDAFKLACLEMAGVDNWCGYGYAMQIYNEEEE